MKARRVTRGDLFTNSAQTLFFIVSLSALLVASCRFFTFLIVFSGLQGSESKSKVLFWMADDVRSMVDYTCPLFCTLILALYRYFSICRSARAYYRNTSSSKLWIYFAAYWSIVFVIPIVKKLFFCKMIPLNLNSNISDIIGIGWYLLCIVLLPVTCLIVITTLHLKTTRRLRLEFIYERASLLNSLGVTCSSSSSNRQTGRDTLDRILLREESRYLFTIRAYVRLVTPALFLRFVIAQLHIVHLVATDKWFFSTVAFQLCEALLLFYIDLLFFSEFAFFIHTNEELKLCLKYPFRDLKQFWDDNS